ncbi:hypothetical protein CDV36_004512 [Fusarium kuroshium]|uniref:Kelch repeat-containing protein n=1 Tax=Fusarium kuroshium TaxID=2010991 RepID=A0A3M2SE79_9HYPO|nr:hypothetical protein CDV36_004512 [Fusarium kuroshium]
MICSHWRALLAVLLFIPSVNGGILWGDEVNKRFYLYGGEWNDGFALRSYHLFSYDILGDKWDDFGTPDISPPPSIASYGAGVGVSQTGMGYYLGGWISKASMTGWDDPRTMSSNFYAYNYDTGEFTNLESPDKQARAEGGMVWLPAGDALGLLVYMGGLVSEEGEDSEDPQPFDEVFVFDAQSNRWFTQKTTGQIPQNRRQFCIDVAWAPDKSSFNIYLWGGLSAPPPVVNTTSFADVYILTIPSFTWVKAWPDSPGNGTSPPEFGHYSSSCNMLKNMSQLFVIGGTYTDTNACDLGEHEWGMHNFWTGTLNNEGDNETYWALYDPNVTTNVVPKDVYDITGGDKEGGATVKEPEDGFDSNNELLEVLLTRRPSIAERSPTRQVSPSPTASTTETPSSSPSGSKLSTGGIVGISIGSVVGLAVIVTVWYCIGKRVVRRREERRRSQMTQPQPQPQPQYYSGYQVSHQGMVSPQTSNGHNSMGYWGSQPSSPQMANPHGANSPPPTELPAEHPAYHGRDVSEVSQLGMNKGNVSPLGIVPTQGHSPPPPPGPVMMP